MSGTTVITRPAKQAAQVRGWLRSSLILVGVMAVIWLITAVAMLIWNDGVRPPITRELFIREGAAAEIANGRNPLEIPSTWTFYEGDMLVLVNQDLVRHQLGGWLVEPGGKTTVVLQSNVAGSFLCTLHPSGEVILDVQLRGFDWPLTMLPTLAMGIPLGLAAVVGQRVWGALDEPRDTWDR